MSSEAPEAAAAARCPDDAALAAFSAADDPDPSIASHLAECAACESRLSVISGDAEFLARVRKLTADELAPAGSPRIPGYRIMAELSSGSQGVVYRAVQERTNRMVAVKTLVSGIHASPRQRARFEREAEIAARLKHTNIVTVFESRVLPSREMAFIMEYVDGVPLDQWRPPGATDHERRTALIRVLIAVCDGVHHAHLNGVIHRDIKPDNILVTGEGKPVVLDFGIAKTQGFSSTVTGEFAGTPAFASPEQVSGRPADVDALTDVYSLGVVAYLVLCGKMPYTVEGSLLDAAHAVKETRPIPPRTANPSIDDDLGVVLLRALAKEKSERYQSAAAFARDLQRYLAGEPVEARRASGWYLLRKAVAMNRRRLVATLAVAVLLAGTVLAVSISMARAKAAANLAAQRQRQLKAEALQRLAVTEMLRSILPTTGSERADPVFTRGMSRLYSRLESGAWSSDPELDQSLRRLWGQVYSDFAAGRQAGSPEYAEVSLRHGLMRLRDTQGEASPEIAETLHVLAGVLQFRSRYDEAESMSRQAAQMRAKLVGEGAIVTADSRLLHARTLLALRREREADTEAAAAAAVYAMQESEAGERRPAAAASLRAQIAMDAGRFADAEPLLDDALRRSLHSAIPDDPDLLDTLDLTAQFAEIVPRSAFTMKLAATVGVDAATFARTLRQDTALIRAGDPGPGEPVRPGRAEAFQRLLRLQETLVAPDSAAAVATLMAIVHAATVEELSELRAGSALKAAELIQSRAGRPDPGAAAYIIEASGALTWNGRVEEGADVARRALDVWDRIPEYARDPLVYANTYRYVALHNLVARRWSDGAQDFRAYLQLATPLLGENHYLVAFGHAGLAACLAELGQLDEAEKESAPACKVAEESRAMPIDQRTHVRFFRAHVMTLRGDNSQARPLLEAAYEVYSRSKPTFPLTHWVVADLVKACAATGDAAAADRWRTLGEELKAARDNALSR